MEVISDAWTSPAPVVARTMIFRRLCDKCGVIVAIVGRVDFMRVRPHQVVQTRVVCLACKKR